MTDPAEVVRHPTADEFVVLVGSALGASTDQVHLEGQLCLQVELDEVSLAELVLAVQEVNPFFELPEQVPLEDLTVADLHHFCCVMGPGHVESTSAGW